MHTTTPLGANTATPGARLRLPAMWKVSGGLRGREPQKRPEQLGDPGQQVGRREASTGKLSLLHTAKAKLTSSTISTSLTRSHLCASNGSLTPSLLSPSIPYTKQDLFLLVTPVIFHCNIQNTKNSKTSHQCEPFKELPGELFVACPDVNDRRCFRALLKQCPLTGFPSL